MTISLVHNVEHIMGTQADTIVLYVQYDFIYVLVQKAKEKIVELFMCRFVAIYYL